MLCNWKLLGVLVLRATKPGVISRIGIISAIAFLLCRQSIASGQIVPDSTLPINSTVTPNGNTLVIEGGSPVGGNLFHSFQEFSVPTGSEAYFNNSLTIANILTRVTGGSISNIDGILLTNGPANLFLLNPNGIVFGPNAALNIGGSFFASTADSLRLSDGSDFSATNPDAPPLLSINVPLGLQLGPSPGKIINQSRAIATNSSNGNNIAGLAVQPGKTIGLVGGDISIEGGSLLAPVGQIELVSLSNGFWQLGQEQNSSLESVPIDNSQFGNIEITRESNVSTSGAGGGSIDVVAGKLSVRDGSQLTAITEGERSGGGLRINAAESVEVIGNNSAEGLVLSQISTETQGAGAGGDLTIETGRLLLAEGGFLSASTFGAGAGGNITIRASESVELIGTGFEAFERDFIGSFVSGEIRLTDRTTGIFTGAEDTGNSGNIAIDTSSFSAKDGTLLFTPSFAEGTGGNIVIRAIEAVEVSGSVFGASNLGAGAAGDIEIDTSELIMANGGLLGNATVGSGSSGNILVRASEKVEIGSTPAGALVGTGIFADSIGSTGAGGNIRIETRQLFVRDGARVSANSGIVTENDIVRVGGAAANIEAIATEEVEISGTSPDGRFRSALTSTTFSSADAGEVRISTGRLIVRDGAEISTSAFGDGAGGDIIIKATEAVNIRGNGFNDFEDNIISNFVSGELTLSDRVTGIIAGTEGQGASGNISIETPELIVEEGSIIFTPAFGSGAGGQISINADRVEAIGSGVSASTSGVGSAGTISIDAAELVVRDGAILGTSTSTSGAGGNIIVRASESVELSSTPTSALIATGMSAGTIGTGAGGNIQIETARLSVRDGARLSTTTGLLTRDGNINVGGKGGSVEVTASENVEVSGVSGNFRSQVTAATFSSADAGEVSIATGSLTVRDGAEISTSAFSDGAGGDLTINATEEVTLMGLGFEDLQQNISTKFLDGTLTLSDRITGLFAGTEGAGGAGNITINTQQLTIADGVLVGAVTFASGQGGRIAIEANKIEIIGSTMAASALGDGASGNIEIDTAQLIVRDGSIMAASTRGAGSGGNIIVRASESVELSSTPTNALIATGMSAGTIGTGAGGNIQIDTARLSLADGVRLSTNTGLFTRDGIINEGGKGGSVEVRASESVEVSGVSGNFRSQVTASTFGSAEAGEVKISTGSLTVRDGAEISVATLGSGKGGTLTVEASETALFTGRSGDGRFRSSLLAASGDPSLETQPTGAAGNLSIIAGELVVTDGARVAVNSLGTGDAGALTAIAGEIILDNRGSMTASPNAAQGGNINLTARDLQLRRGSGISTDAGASDGGNITIQTDNLAALENSDISANAQAGFGGRVSINAEGIFGTAFRERQTPKSDITATSELGPQFSGVVEINTPEVDPGAGLVKLPETVVDITALVARDPCHHQDESEFIITGRGGLPPSPLDPLSNPVMAIEWANPENAASAGVSRESNTRASNTRASNTRASNTRASNTRASNTRARASERSNSTAFSREEQFTEREYFVETRHLENRDPENRHPENRHIVEATGWRVDEEGDIILTADSPNVAPYRPGLTAPSCGEGR